MGGELVKVKAFGVVRAGLGVGADLVDDLWARVVEV